MPGSAGMFHSLGKGQRRGFPDDCINWGIRRGTRMTRHFYDARQYGNERKWRRSFVHRTVTKLSVTFWNTMLKEAIKRLLASTFILMCLTVKLNEMLIRWLKLWRMSTGGSCKATIATWNSYQMLQSFSQVLFLSCGSFVCSVVSCAQQSLWAVRR